MSATPPKQCQQVALLAPVQFNFVPNAVQYPSIVRLVRSLKAPGKIYLPADSNTFNGFKKGKNTADPPGGWTTDNTCMVACIGIPILLWCGGVVCKARAACSSSGRESWHNWV